MSTETAMFGLFILEIDLEHALAASQPGVDASEQVQWLVDQPYIEAQLDAITGDDLRLELDGYGCWDDDELADDDANRQRIVWVACCDIREELGL